jgi:TfoX/Sxy family transcriptional regulator of competence genes
MSGPGMPKPSEAAKDRFHALVPDDPTVTTRPMFGNLAAFAGDQMFFGLFGDALFVRLGDDERAALMAEGASQLEPMPGRPMREYVVLPPAMVDDEQQARAWIQRSLTYAAGLPPKKKAGKR